MADAGWGRRTAQNTVWISSQKAENAHLLSNKQVRVLDVHVLNITAAALFVQLFDSDKLPALGDVPVDALPLPADGAAGWNFGERGRVFENGCSWAVSTTAISFTAPGVDSAFGAAGVLR